MRELIQRLYAPTDEAGRRRIDAALLRANPRLSELGNLPEGTPVMVPPVEGASMAQGESSREAQVNTASQAQRGLAAYRAALKQAIDHEIELVKGQLELVNNERMTGLAGDDQHLQGLIKTLTSSLDQRIEGLGNRLETLD